MPYKFNKGDKVQIANASHSWGDIVPGDIGTIIHIDRHDKETLVYLDIPGKMSGWVCTQECLNKLPPTIAPDNNATEFFGRLQTNARELLDSGVALYMTDSPSVRLAKHRAIAKPPDADLFNSMKDMLDSISFKDDKMYITTKRCNVRFNHPSVGTLHVDVGYFKVMVNFTNSRVEITQQDLAKFYAGAYDHPHVSNHSPCWGTYYEPVRRAIQNIDICSVIRLLLDYLNSCDQHGWYRSILHWLTPDELQRLHIEDYCQHCNLHNDDCECDRCGNCDAREGNCDCNYCDHCDRWNEDCECVRCPDSYDRLEDNQFPDGGCNNCRNLCKDLENGEWICAYDGMDTPRWTAGLADYTPSEATARYQTRTEDGAVHDHPNTIKAQAQRQASQYIHVWDSTVSTTTSTT